MNRILAPILALLLCAGCAATSQRYVERTYGEPDAEGWQPIESETTVRNRTVAPPFGAKAVSDHRFTTTVNEDGSYVLDMGRNRFSGPGSELLHDETVVDLYLGGRGRLAAAATLAEEDYEAQDGAG